MRKLQPLLSERALTHEFAKLYNLKGELELDNTKMLGYGLLLALIGTGIWIIVRFAAKRRAYKIRQQGRRKNTHK